MNVSQQTIRNEGSLSGVGIHTGTPCTLFFKPAAPDTGICFIKNGRSFSVGLGEGPLKTDTARCTSIGDAEARILTVEHLMAALSGLGLTNLLIEVRGDEIPILDGSAKDFVEKFKALGIERQSAERTVYAVSEPIFCYEGTSALAALPSDTLTISYTLDYPHPMLRGQKVEWTGSDGSFEREIAPARTFCTQEEAQELRKKGLGLGGTTKNTIIMGESGPVDNALRFPNECARHKILDLFGDLSLLGFAVHAKIIGIRSGHSLNHKLARLIKAQREASFTRAA
jgi:UDP-3-O-acyl N-acetylglucosamine deacetylase